MKESIEAATQNAVAKASGSGRNMRKHFGDRFDF
ncbi:MAG: hypothetical protein H8E75_00955 [Puniceicoccaceae bacterium]|nr:hypothetical protein [Puniceicoccaceae bacterium]MBL6838450.1 hypothetical protein [Puniceicoccaceae bacterium]MBL6912889.1 hypothetical protein [Puniceicoccaceae bacterium]